MALFGDKNTGDYVTREEAQSTLRGYVTQGEGREFRDSLIADFDALTTRVSALEALAEQLKRSNPAGLPVRTPAREENRTGVTRDPITGGTVRAQGSPVTTASTTGVDYGAIAFGLSEIKRKISQHLPAQEVAREFVGVVQYFADVFAKADTGFDVDAFKRLSGV